MPRRQPATITEQLKKAIADTEGMSDESPEEIDQDAILVELLELAREQNRMLAKSWMGVTLPAHAFNWTYGGHVAPVSTSFTNTQPPLTLRESESQRDEADGSES